jgi:hypothetical protein
MSGGAAQRGDQLGAFFIAEAHNLRCGRTANDTQDRRARSWPLLGARVKTICTQPAIDHRRSHSQISALFLISTSPYPFLMIALATPHARRLANWQTVRNQTVSRVTNW